MLVVLREVAARVALVLAAAEMVAAEMVAAGILAAAERFVPAQAAQGTAHQSLNSLEIARI